MMSTSEGVLTYLVERGCAALMGRFVTRNPYTWVPFFYQKILKHGSTFLTEPKFLGFCMAKTAKFLKNGPIFQEKILKMGTLFCQNHPYRWVGVLRLTWHTPVQLKSEYPPPPGQLQ